MKRSYIFLATGFEEIEALGTADVLRRGGLDVTLVSIYKDRMVTGAHGITVAADVVFDGADFDGADWLIFPGGMPGAKNLAEYQPLVDLLTAHAAAGGHIAAICAAPAVVLATYGILTGRKATCYPGFEGELTGAGAEYVADSRVVVDGNVTTANGPSSAILFGASIVEQSAGKAVADKVLAGMLVNAD